MCNTQDKGERAGMKDDILTQSMVPCKAVESAKSCQLSKSKIKFSGYEAAVRSVGVLLARAMPIFEVAPFGVAYLSVERRFSIGALVSAAMAALGYATFFDMSISVRYICAIGVYLLFLFAVGRDGSDIPSSAAISAAGVGVALADFGYMIWCGFSLGGIIQLLCDVVLTVLSGVLLEKNRCIFLGKKNGLFTMNSEEKLCFGIFAVIILLGFKSIKIDGYFYAANIISLWLITIFALCGSIGAAVVCGAVSGIIAGLWGNIFVQTGVFTICAAVGGVAAKKGKSAAVGAVAFSAVVLLLTGGVETAEIFGYTDIPLFAIAVILTPDYVIRNIKRITGVGRENTNEERCREYVRSRLNSASDSFRNLAETFLDLSDKHNNVDMEDVAALFDGVADRVCRECSKVSECWVTGFNSTYKSMFRMLEIAERRGEIAESDADNYFAKKCLRLRSITREMNRLFEIYKINCVWKSKLCENRELAGQQLAGVAQILDDISCELCEEKPDVCAEEEIRMRLAAKNIEAGTLDVTVNPKGIHSAYIEIIGCENPEECRRKAEGALRSVLGVRLAAVGVSETKGGLLMKFAQPESFKIEAGSAGVGHREECGDNCAMRYLSGGKYAAALSDGMGTGHKASRDSGATVRLLGDFLEAGFDREIAVRLINSIMVMKSANEAFATVDMCVIDLYSGEAEFIKNGAEASYIKRADRTETVRAASLPVGVMQNVEIESFAHRLESGDIVVMLSDGLQMKQGYEEWIKTMIDEADRNMPPQELADRIIDMAVTLRGGEVEDDMTVMVMKMTER